MTDTQEPDEIRAEIEETRRELGETVAALSAKTDVKAQAQHRIEEVKATANERKEEILGRARQLSPDSARQAATAGQSKARENPIPTAAIGGFLGGFLFGRISKRRR